MRRFVIVLIAAVACHRAATHPRYPLAPQAACRDGARVTVLGSVTRPGVIACRAGMRLREALAAAGGLTPLAWANQTRLRRSGRTYLVPVGAILDGEAPDPVLGADDLIVVGERDI